MPRNPFAFLDDGTKDRTLMLLLLAILRKQGGELILDLTDLTSIEDGASFHKYPDDTGSRLVLRYARRGAEAFFLRDADSDLTSRPTTTTRRPASASSPPPPPLSPSAESLPSTPLRHALHDDVDLALRESQMAEHAERAQRERLRQAREQSGALPWTIRRPQ
jgi:hypothetical protein